jgi:NADH-quinone oxidoreductase subunit M
VGHAGGHRLALVSILYGALLAIGQTDMMRLIAYTSISHFGFIVLGIFAIHLDELGRFGFYMINHGFSTAGLFLVAGMLIAAAAASGSPTSAAGSESRPGLAGVWLHRRPVRLALPGLGSFVSEFLVLAGTFQRHQVVAVIATTGIILAALYILLMYQRTMTGPKPESAAGTP